MGNSIYGYYSLKILSNFSNEQFFNLPNKAVAE